MAAPLIFYSTNTWLAFQIAERYYKGKHYVWCSPFFHSQSDKGAAGFVAPTSTPWESYRSLHKEWKAGDRHSTKIERNRDGILRGARFRREAGVISRGRQKVIGSIVEDAEIRDFEPLVYVMPYARVARLASEVPIKDRAHPLSQEYVIENLPRRLFDLIRLELLRVSMERTLKIEGMIDSARSSDDAVEATYLATRLISHRGLLERGLSRKGFLARFPQSSPRSRRLALAIIEEITKRESAPLHLIPQEKLDRYTRGLSRAMWRRVKEEWHLDAGQGRALLEEMRRTGEARLRPQTS